MGYNYSEEEKQKIKSILPKEKNKFDDPLILNILLQQKEQQILDFYSEIFNKHSFLELLITQALHLELLLKELILIGASKFTRKEVDDFSFYDAINIAYLEGLIPDYFAKKYHLFRIKRNLYAHKFFFAKQLEFKEHIENMGNGCIFIFEVNKILKEKIK